MCLSEDHCIQLFCSHYLCKLCILVNGLQRCDVCANPTFTGSIHVISLDKTIDQLEMVFRAYYLARKYILYLADELTASKLNHLNEVQVVERILAELSKHPNTLAWPHNISKLRDWYGSLREHMFWI